MCGYYIVAVPGKRPGLVMLDDDKVRLWRERVAVAYTASAMRAAILVTFGEEDAEVAPLSSGEFFQALRAMSRSSTGTEGGVKARLDDSPRPKSPSPARVNV